MNRKYINIVLIFFLFLFQLLINRFIFNIEIQEIELKLIFSLLFLVNFILIFISRNHVVLGGVEK